MKNEDDQSDTLDAKLLKIRAVLSADYYPRTDVCRECGRKNDTPALPSRSPELSARVERALNLGIVNVGHDVPVNTDALAAVSKAVQRTLRWRQILRLTLRRWLFALAAWATARANRT